MTFGARRRAQSQQTLASIPADGDQGIRALERLQEAPVKRRPGQAIIAVPDVAAVAGNHRRHTQPVPAEHGQVSRRINAVAVQDVEAELAMAAKQPPAIPAYQPAHRKKFRMSFHVIGKAGIITGPEGMPPRRQHHDLVPRGRELPGQGVHDELLPPHLRQGGFGIQADAHAVTSLAPGIKSRGLRLEDRGSRNRRRRSSILEPPSSSSWDSASVLNSLLLFAPSPGSRD